MQVRRLVSARVVYHYLEGTHFSMLCAYYNRVSDMFQDASFNMRGYLGSN